MPRMVFDAEADQLLRDHEFGAGRARSAAEKTQARDSMQGALERALLKAYELGKRHGAGEK